MSVLRSHYKGTADEEREQLGKGLGSAVVIGKVCSSAIIL
jgi:hypothetical protein